MEEIKIELDTANELTSIGTHIKIIGVGGAGGNAINTMIENSLEGVEFIAANTNIIDLKKSKAMLKLQLGKETTKGLGTGAHPELGRQSAEESREDVKHHLDGADMVFIVAGMGGGTGTGAAPIIASMAKEMGILTIGIVNRPFNWEGKKRRLNAQEGIKQLAENVDSLIVIPNEKIKEQYSDLTVIQAFKKADNILYDAAKALSDIINFSGYISVDFADVKTVMSNKGYAMIGTGIGEGENRAVDAAKAAMSNPLLSDVSLKNSQGILINITASEAVKMDEFEQIFNNIISETGDQGDIINGIIFDEKMEDKIKVTLIATGLKMTNTKIYEIENFKSKNEDSSEELNDILERIRNPRTNDIEKQQQENNQQQIKPKMDIPAFMRKFSN